MARQETLWFKFKEGICSKVHNQSHIQSSRSNFEIIIEIKGTLDCKSSRSILQVKITTD